MEDSFLSEKKAKPNDAVKDEENLEEETESEALVSFNILKPPKNVIERYCNQYFLIDINGKENEDQYIYQHLNNLCIVGVASSHPLCDRNFSISKVDFDVGNKNRLQNEIHGKKKKGATWVEAEFPLCEITRSDGKKYTLLCGVQGFLMEVNERLLNEPNLIQQMGLTEGYVAIITPKVADREAIKLGKLSLEDYNKLRTRK